MGQQRQVRARLRSLGRFCSGSADSLPAGADLAAVTASSQSGGAAPRRGGAGTCGRGREGRGRWAGLCRGIGGGGLPRSGSGILIRPVPHFPAKVIFFLPRDEPSPSPRAEVCPQ